ncbi:QueT transporter family protein [Anaerotignum lactatifermentans]|uniref:QueT transporter family protein n=1 Tax=Anaerotignum lactatifermentans TaxID=160404 RepID=A0ABS2G5M6_9FIRM|nr:QueT transporter family protein [Anaerotignum lactatifermentans]MBM6828096.1 QueT transporter family protein [Anaerotignum lactatifermentans]MBM6876741.1 QueT transporter family protein [Anaerotignum lactatifermentans]MBM6949679.1 QueT transporter family protein [Anaerotignum lactatifermentans]
MQKNSITTKMVAYTALVAAVYAVMTLAVAPLSFGAVQLRVSEILVLLAFLDKRYAPGLILGCFIANCFSPLGMVDAVFGTACTAAALLGITHSKTLFGASLWPVVCNAFLGVEYYFLQNAPLLLTAGSIAAGEFLAVSCIGYVVFRQVLKNGALVRQLQIG